MKKILLTSAICLSFLGGTISYAEQTVPEKVEVKAKDAKRSVKKGYHRAKEKVCMKDDAKCLAEKAKHRAHEVKDTVKDKADEVKDKVD